MDSSGTVLSETRYLPFGAVRDDVGTISQTDFTYTFQRDLPDVGLMDYKARFYSPRLARFIQPDSLVPGAANPQSWNRFTYTLNNPLKYSDPTGHWEDEGCGSGNLCELLPEKEPEPGRWRPDRYGDVDPVLPPPTSQPVIPPSITQDDYSANGFPPEIGYRIPSIPMTSFPIDIWIWRWTIKADGNVTYRTPLSPIVISADGFVVGDGNINLGDSTYWFSSATIGQEYNSTSASVGAKFSWDSVSMVSRNSVSYTNGNYSLNVRLTQEFEYRPKNAATVVAVPIVIYGGYTVFGGIYGALQTLVGVGTAACQSGFCK